VTVNEANVDRAVIDKVLAQIDKDEVVRFHQSLVRVPSVNPPGDVREAIALCEQSLKHAGFETRLVAVEEAKPNLIATCSGQPGPTLCFNAHLDVVPIGERSAWQHDPFGAEIVDGKIYGRGAGDDKASVAAQVMAAVALARAGVELHGTLVVNEVADEEVGGVSGAKMVVEAGHIKSDYVIVGEQTLNRVCVGEKGSAGTTITVYGRTAHGALPWEGANAIEGMAEVISALRRELWPQLENRTHQYFHHSSASVNIITGGVKSNVVPDVCEIYIDRRLIPGEDPKLAVAEIDEIAQKAVRDIPGISVTVEGREQSLPATVSAPDAPLVRSMIEANRIIGGNTEPTGFSMATDGRFFAKAGCPTIIYGPGDPKLAHVPDEWVGVDELYEATRAYAVAALLLLGGE
jgi:succinyl-diaminopimelate desuccinylase